LDLDCFYGKPLWDKRHRFEQAVRNDEPCPAAARCPLFYLSIKVKKIHFWLRWRRLAHHDDEQSELLEARSLTEIKDDLARSDC
jgi:hypothetical protein